MEPGTGALCSGASELRNEDWTGELVAELQETTVEVGTPVSSSAHEAGEHLARLRFQAGTVARAHDLAVVAAGLHPFSAWEGHERPPIERYRKIEERYGRIARDEHIYGMHIHVGVPDGVDRLGVINVLRQYLPHLLGLSASSPFLEGGDTGFASYRAILWRRWPNSGVPPRFESSAEFDHYVQMMLDAGVMADPWNIYWSLRAHPEYPTIEFRVTDVCPNLRDAVALTALARALVHATVTGELGDDMLEHMSPGVEQEVLRVNEWRAARDGLDAVIIDTRASAGHEPLRTAVERLIERTAASAEALGDVTQHGQLRTILERGNAADRMRSLMSERQSMQHLVDWLRDETLVGTGLDRRAVQRDGE